MPSTSSASDLASQISRHPQTLRMLAVVAVALGAAIYAGLLVAGIIRVVTAHTGLWCPACGSREVRRSHRRGFRDWIYTKFACLPVRCSSCAVRYYVRRESYETGTQRPGAHRHTKES